MRQTMKQQPESEEDFQMPTQLAGMTYDQILASFEDATDLNARTYIPALCMTYKLEHPDAKNETIKDRVRKDCLRLGRWTETHIDNSFSKYARWVNRPWMHSEDFWATQEAQEQLAGLRQDIGSISDTVDQVKQEQQTRLEPAEEEKPTSIKVTPDKPKRQIQRTPMQAYEYSVKTLGKAWLGMMPQPAKKHKLITSDTVDTLLDQIKPTRPYRLRLIKGLDEERANHYQRVLVRMNMLIQDTLKMCQDINKERTKVVTK